ncbi:MaoC family dehydratase N-terminal domain-containing protein [Desulfosporosinus sp. BICA1-9]|uniref:FAS1-like dehydratase domain-containing protein n=1 Tax=Desulfosporosinus sp. BICA1-9 TaxID=1531958 RepID=UPI000ACA816A|nr:MaoC family dehydratase N-terminal domain-containing protein [Desulfosporosinus sp. BICA1-9]
MVKIIGKDLIGRESKPVRVKIEADVVRRFAETVGIPFENRVPPTFFGTFMKGSIEGVDLFQPGTIHGEQKFVYFQSVSIGDNIVYTRRIKDVFERSGKVGKMTFVIVETTGCNHAGEQVFSMSSTVIFSDHRDEI